MWAPLTYNVQQWIRRRWHLGAAQIIWRRPNRIAVAPAIFTLLEDNLPRFSLSQNLHSTRGSFQPISSRILIFPSVGLLSVSAEYIEGPDVPDSQRSPMK
jgi:hypothetical protein